MSRPDRNEKHHRHIELTPQQYVSLIHIYAIHSVWFFLAYQE